MNRAALVAAAISDRANPVVVKELRQAVQSRLVIAILMLFLLVNVLVVSGYLILSLDATTSERAGMDLFTCLFVVLVSTCMVFVPLYTAARLTMERNDSNIDLLFITTIRPAAIIRGKFWAAVAITGLIYSVCLPFLTFTYLLRGIDLPSIFLSLAVAFLLTALTNMLAIFVGSVAGGLVLRIFMGGVLLYLGGCALVVANGIGLQIARMGLAWMFAGSDGWAAFGVSSLLGLCVWGLLYLMAVAAVSPRSSNRIFPIRVQMTATWAIFGVVMGVWTWNIANDGPLMFWSLASAGVLSATLPLAMAERENWTPRLRRHIPRTLPARLLAWLFYTGSAGGVIWSAALGAVSLWVGYAIVEWPGFFKSPIGSKHALNIMLGVAMFTWCYCLSGLFVRRMLIPRSPPLAGTTIAMLLLGVLGAAPLVVAYLVIGPEWQFESMPIAFAIANPFVLSRSAHDQIVVRMFLGVWAGLALLVNLPWFSRQWRAFQRYEPKPILPSEARAEEPPVVQV